MSFVLSPETAVEYLRERGLAVDRGAVDVRSHGGRSNRVVAVTHDAGCVVLKQPRRELDDEGATWVGRGRVHNEAAALRALGDLLDGSVVAVPAVRFEDHDDHLVGIECVPGEATGWRAALHDGRVDAGVAAELGAALARVHAGAADDAGLRTRVEGPAFFERLRIDRYHRPVAERHPDLAGPIREEVDRIAGRGATLIHGDYNPKNVLLARRPAGPDAEARGQSLVDAEARRPWIIDAEFACWGDPAWDVASMVAHLYVPALAACGPPAPYLRAAERFRAAYRKGVPWEIERAAAVEAAILLLARVDGRATLSFLSADAAGALRRAGSVALREPVRTLSGVADVVRAECDRG